jgi:polysaccharide biosynthesis protein PelA
MHTLRFCFGFALSLVATLCFGGTCSDSAGSFHSIAFYYGNAPVVSDLSRFDMAVLEPDNGFAMPRAPASGTRWIAYVSVGEVSPSRDYYAAIPKSWIIGRNDEWQSDIIDQGNPDWPSFFVQHVIAPLSRKGYSGFFLDTLDSYQSVASDHSRRSRSQQGMITLIHLIHRRFPKALILLNRGFEILPAVHGDICAVAFESLYKGWDERAGRYMDVSAEDRKWLLTEAGKVKKRYDLPVVAIDYCDPSDEKCARGTVQRIRAAHLVPYVGDGRLHTLNFAALR